MLRLLVLFVSLACVLGGPAKIIPQPRHNGNRIIGGDVAKDGEFPYIVSLNWEDYGHACGASVLTPQWLLTAAHCCKAGPFEVYAGSNNNHENGQSYEAVQYIVHEDYDPDALWSNDVCVIKLKNRMALNDRVKQTTIPYQGMPTNDGERVTLFGWGYTDPDSPILPDQLMVGRNWSAMSNKKCGDQTGVDMIDGYICVNPGGVGHGSCGGDSGSPLVRSLDNVQLGTVSWGWVPCGGEMPGFYSRTSTYTDWIAKKLGDDAKELKIVDKN